MEHKTSGVATVFTLLLVVTLGGILLHRLTGYNYPTSPAFDFELNILGDLYEAFFLLPVGLVGLWSLRKGSVWGPLLIAGVATYFAYSTLGGTRRGQDGTARHGTARRAIGPARDHARA